MGRACTHAGSVDSLSYGDDDGDREQEAKRQNARQRDEIVADEPPAAGLLGSSTCQVGVQRVLKLDDHTKSGGEEQDNAERGREVAA